MPYDRGDLVHLAATFLGSANVAADASSIYLLLIDPSGSRATHKYGLTPSQIVRAATGAYFLDLDVEISGWWGYRWEATGGIQTASESRFEVGPTFKL